MAEYLPTKYKWNESHLRSEAYVFTVGSLDDPTLLALRKEIKRHNKAMRALARQTGQEYYADRLKRIRVMPRGPRVEAAWDDYKSRKAYDSYLPMRHGTHFDIYIQDDDKAYKLKTELRHGLTPGVQARLEQQRAEQLKLEWAHNKEMHDRGFYEYAGQWMTRDRAADAMEREGLPKSWTDRIRNG